ncbi:hypothetical protein FRC17_002364 [Serendipita sp. 399]|nr:hypothetical protein FRC17_002364 [Serendipita sp. 399]
MQLPTLVNTRLRSTADAHLIIHAARLGHLRMVTRRLDSQERSAIQVGNIYVWEERGALDLSGLGIERWTDGLRWGPSRLRNDFLFYQQREDAPRDKRRETEPHDPPVGLSMVDELDQLIKQTYSVHVYDGPQPANRRIKLHITAYFSRRAVESLNTVDSNPILQSLVLPPGLYRSARVGKPKSGETTNGSDDGSSPTSERSPSVSDRDGYDRLPPIMASGVRSPVGSENYFDFAGSPPSSGVGPYHDGPRGAYSPTMPDKRTQWHNDQRFYTESEVEGRPVTLPSLRSALGSVWNPTRRNAEDDLQLARLDIARALV